MKYCFTGNILFGIDIFMKKLKVVLQKLLNVVPIPFRKFFSILRTLLKASRKRFTSILNKFSKLFQRVRKILKKSIVFIKLKITKFIKFITNPFRRFFSKANKVRNKLSTFIKTQTNKIFKWFYKFKLVQLFIAPFKFIHTKLIRLNQIRAFIFFKNILKFVVITFLITIVFSAVLGGFLYLRYRETCSYQSLTEQGHFEQNNIEDDFCPNLLSIDGIKIALKNLITFNPEQAFVVSNNTSNIQSVDPNNPCRDPNGLSCLLSQMNGDLKRTGDRTNILIAGSDSRNEGIKGNMDTIIFMSYYHTTGQVMMVSFPRDLVVQHTTPQGWTTLNRINAIFNSYGYYDPDVGVQAFNMAIEQIFDQPLHYYLYINFNVFNRVIDSLGTIDIYLDEPFRDAFPCNESHGFSNLVKYSENPNYCIFEFPQGWNSFNWMRANIYSRARYFSSDYSRVARQQKVLEAIMSTVLKKPMTVREKFEFANAMFNEVLPQIRTNATIEDIVGIFKVISNLKTNAARVVLSPAVNNYSLIYSAGWSEQFSSHQKFYDYSYRPLRNYINDIWNNLSFYIDQPKIRVVDSVAGIPGESNLAAFLNSNPKFTSIIRATEENLDLKGIRIYNITGKSGAVQEIKRRVPELKSYDVFVDDIKQSDFGEDILIIYNP